MKKCLVDVEKLDVYENYDAVEQEDMRSRILQYSHIENAKNVWKKIHSNGELMPEEKIDYCLWKEWICAYLKAEYGKILRENT